MNALTMSVVEEDTRQEQKALDRTNPWEEPIQ